VAPASWPAPGDIAVLTVIAELKCAAKIRAGGGPVRCVGLLIKYPCPKVHKGRPTPKDEGVFDE